MNLLKAILLVLFTLLLASNYTFSHQKKSVLNYFEIENKDLSTFIIEGNNNIEYLRIVNCKGILSNVLNQVNRKYLTHLSIHESLINDDTLDFDSWDEASIWFRVHNSNIRSRIISVNVFKSIYILNSNIEPFDLEKISKNIVQLVILECHNSILKNIKRINELTKIIELHLSFSTIENRAFSLDNLVDLELLGLSNILELPKLNLNINLNSLYLSRIFLIYQNDLYELLKANIEVESLYLTELNLNNNFKLPKLDSLKTLGLHRNMFTEFPVDILNLKSLRTLSLSYNFISKLNYQIFENKNLVQLDIEYNKLHKEITKQESGGVIINQEGNPFD